MRHKISERTKKLLDELKTEWTMASKPCVPPDLICGCFGGPNPEDIGFGQWLAELGEGRYEVVDGHTDAKPHGKEAYACTCDYDTEPEDLCKCICCGAMDGQFCVGDPRRTR